MNEVVKVEIPVDAEAAEVLKDAAARERLGKLLSRIALLHQGKDPLIELLGRTAAKARESGLTDGEIDAELAAYNAERRS
ncbi:MAG: hypothetical protein WBQ75_14310 [Acetobacteraceae bacterium]